MADAGSGVDHRHGGDALQRGLEPRAAAGEDEIHGVGLRGKLRELLAATTGNETDRAIRHSGAARRLSGNLGQHCVRASCRTAAAQDAGVAGLQAERGGIDRHVGPRLIDDGHNAKGHQLASQLDAVGEAPAVEHLADRVRERGHIARLLGDRGDALGGKREAVDQRAGEASCRAVIKIAPVRVKNGVGVRNEGVGDRVQRAVLDLGRQRGQLSRGCTGRRADLRNGGGSGRHQVSHPIADAPGPGGACGQGAPAPGDSCR